MNIGIPREIKNNENRVAMVPDGVASLTRTGHRVQVETQAGIGSGISDQAFIDAGAEIISGHEAVFDNDMIIKVKEPVPSEYALLRNVRRRSLRISILPPTRHSPAPCSSRASLPLLMKRFVILPVICRC